MIYEKTLDEFLNETQERRENIKRYRYTCGIDLNKTFNEIEKSFNETINKAIEEAKNRLTKIMAIKIVTKKNVDILALDYWIRVFNGKLTYKTYLGILKDYNLGGKLTQEEFKIVKKVLLWTNWK